MRTLYLCGVGNVEGIRLALQVNRAVERWQRVVLLDDDGTKHGTQRLGLPVTGGFDRLAEADRTSDQVVNLVTRTTERRAKARGKIDAYGVPFASLVHPDVDCLGTQLDDEVTIYANASIGAEARLARSTAILIGAVVGHGSRLGQGCVVAPNAVINARAVIEDNVYVGSNATILPDLRIGAGATIAANSLVLSDVPAGATALGVPATLLQSSSAMDRRTMIAGAGGARANGSDDLDAPTGSVRHSPHRLQLEQAITGAIGQVLSIGEIPSNGNFFDLGGSSLTAVLLCKHLREGLGLDARLLDLYRFPTAAALSAHFTGEGTAHAPLERAEKRATQRLSQLLRSRS